MELFRILRKKLLISWLKYSGILLLLLSLNLIFIILLWGKISDAVLLGFDQRILLVPLTLSAALAYIVLSNLKKLIESTSPLNFAKHILDGEAHDALLLIQDLKKYNYNQLKVRRFAEKTIKEKSHWKPVDRLPVTEFGILSMIMLLTNTLNLPLPSLEISTESIHPVNLPLTVKIESQHLKGKVEINLNGRLTKKINVPNVKHITFSPEELRKITDESSEIKIQARFRKIKKEISSFIVFPPKIYGIQIRVVPPEYLNEPTQVLSATSIEVPERSSVSLIVNFHGTSISNEVRRKFFLKIETYKNGNAWKSLKTVPSKSVKIPIGKLKEPLQVSILPELVAKENEKKSLKGESSPLISFEVIPDQLPSLKVTEPQEQDIENPQGILSYKVQVEDDREVNSFFIQYISQKSEAVNTRVNEEKVSIKPSSAIIVEGNWTPPFALFPGEAVKIRFGAKDNCPWHPPVLSEWFTLRTPPLSSYYKDIARGIEEAGNSLQKAYKELKHSQKKLAEEPPGTTRNWESKQRSKELVKKIQQTRKKISQTARKLENLKKRASKLSPEDAVEVLENIAKLQKLLKELNISLEHLNLDKIQAQPQQAQEDLKRILEKLKRTVSLLEKLAREVQLKEFLKRVEELKEEQREANKIYREENKIPENQEAIASKEKRLSSDINTTKEDYPEVKNLLQEASNSLQQASVEAMKKNIEGGEHSLEKLIEAESNLRRALQQQIESENREVFNAIKELLKFSVAASIHTREFLNELYTMSFTEKQNYAIALEKSYTLSGKYMEVLLKNLFFVPHTLTATYNQGYRLAVALRESLTSSPSQLENIYQDRKYSLEEKISNLYTTLNKFSYELLKFMEQLKKEGMEQNYNMAVKNIEKALKGQQKLSRELHNSMKKLGPNGIPTPTLQRMAKEQSELQKLLEEALKTIRSKEVEGAQGAMKGAEKKLKEGKTQEALREQKKAEANLLEFEKSDIVKGKSRKREAERAEKELYSKTKGVRESQSEQRSISQFVPSTIPPRLRDFVIKFLEEGEK